MWPKLILAILFVVFYLATKDLAFKYFGFEPTLPMKVILGVNPTTIRPCVHSVLYFHLLIK